MKALFLLLLLLNLGALAWQFMDAPTAPQAAIEANEPKTLVLLRELSPEQLKQLAPVAEPSSFPEEFP